MGRMVVRDAAGPATPGARRGRGGDADRDRTGAAPSAGGAPTTDAAGRRVLYWHDPMVPGQRFDKPGKSPFMDMMLVPVYADAGADEGTLAISPRLAQSFGVRLIEAKAGTLGGGFSAPGTLVVDERTIVAVQARVQGYVEKLLVRATYDSVRAGQPLAELYVPEWLAAQEELLALKASAQPGRRRDWSTRRGCGWGCSACPPRRSRGSSAKAGRRRG